jgi:hypothetical protein
MARFGADARTMLRSDVAALRQWLTGASFAA